MALVALILLLAVPVLAQDAIRLRERALEILVELIRCDTTNPPGNETRAAEYLRRFAAAHGIESELAGSDPERLNFIARLKGSGQQRPLLMMAHTDVVPADPAEWTADPFGAEIRDGVMYGRGTLDTKGLLAAEMAVLVELKLRKTRLKRDIIVLAEADEESGSTGMRWLVANAWDRIEAELALNEGGYIQQTASKRRVCHVQTAEKIPTRVALVARGTAGHASLPRPDNAIMRLARALLRLDTDQPVRLNATTRRYFSELAKVEDYQWMAALLPKLEYAQSQLDAAASIRARDPELDAQLRTSISPTMLAAGVKINVIPNTAEAQLDIRRLPDESAEEVVGRLRRMIHDEAVEVRPLDVDTMPATEPSSITSPGYRALERALHRSAPRTVVVPFMSRGATDGAFLRQKGVAVYGVPLFLREDSDSRAHGNNERISVLNLQAGTELLWHIVLAIAE